MAGHRPIDALQTTFLRPGYTGSPVTYRVDPLHDGASLTTRLITATQHDRIIFTGAASFQQPEPGLAHQLTTFSATHSENVEPPARAVADSRGQSWLSALQQTTMLEFHFPDIPIRISTERGIAVDPHQKFWIRPVRPLPKDRSVHTAVLGYLSDALLLSTSLGPHRKTVQDPGMQFATINHSIWFHAPCKADDWLWYEQEGIWAGSARALCRGSIFRRSGELAATVVQEGLIRVPPE